MVSVNRLSVARALVEYDVSQPLLRHIWIDEVDSRFWQDIIFERVPFYCASCKHLGHYADDYYVTNPRLWKSQQPISEPQDRDIRDKGKQPMSVANVQPCTLLFG